MLFRRFSPDLSLFSGLFGMRLRANLPSTMARIRRHKKGCALLSERLETYVVRSLRAARAAFEDSTFELSSMRTYKCT